VHDLAADGLEGMLHFQIVEDRILRQDLFQQFSELGDVPLPVAKIEDQHPLGLFRLDIEGLVKGSIGLDHMQIRIKEDQWFTDRIEDVAEDLENRLQSCRSALNFPDDIVHFPEG